MLGTGKMGTKALKRPDRSLAFFVMALQGHTVIIELRNTAFVKGTVYIADMYMKYDLLWLQVIANSIINIHGFCRLLVLLHVKSDHTAQWRQGPKPTGSCHSCEFLPKPHACTCKAQGFVM